MFDGMTTVTQGSVGLGIAIGYFASKAITVAVPLIDNQDYDLIIDIDEQLKKVQIKTTSMKAISGNYVVQLKAVRPNRTSNRIKIFDKLKVDYLFILTEENTRYLIPTGIINTTSALTLTDRLNSYKV
jgi:hypothetical protein